MTTRSPKSIAALDRTRVAVTLGGVATMALIWIWACAVATSPALVAVPWLMLQVACLSIVLAPSLAGAHGNRQTVIVAGLAAASIVVAALVAFALELAPMTPLTPVTAVVGSLLAVGAAALQVPAATAPMSSGPGAPAVVPKSLAHLTKASDGGDVTLTADISRFNVGTRIGRYTLESRLAVGGMGEVWRASHDTLIRPAVLKIIRRKAGSDDAELVERFRREAMVTANLTSPHTVHLYDFGLEDDDSLYIAMELLEAMSIGQIVTRFGPMEEARVAFLLRQACHSLIEAHDMGVVHRDLKPDNLLVTRAGRDLDFLKVIDFGLVKELAGNTRRPTTGKRARFDHLTAIGARPGTPGYMAPEQIDGSVVDQRSDIYALACVAYYALTGLPVFEGTQDAQLMFAHMQIEPEAPSARVGRTLHAGLEAAVMRCLAKNPFERHASMVELDGALAALAFDEPWTQRHAQAWWTEDRMKLRTRALADT